MGIGHRAAIAVSSLRNTSEPNPVFDGIAWIEDDSVIRLEATQNLGEVLFAVAHPHNRLPRPFAVTENTIHCGPERNNAPEGICSVSEHSYTRIRTRAFVHADMSIQAITLAERTLFTSIGDDVNQHIDPLLLDAESGILGESPGLDPAHATRERHWSAPLVQDNCGARSHFRRLGGEHFNNHFQIPRITKFDQRRADPDGSAAPLLNAKNAPRDGSTKQPFRGPDLDHMAAGIRPSVEP
jgi:hypothetical protein